MDNGYKKFFKKARENAEVQSPTGKSKGNLVFVKNKWVEKDSQIRNQRDPQKKVNRKSSPVVTFVCFFGFILALLGFYFIEDSDHFLSHIEISFFGKAHAQGKKETPAGEQKDSAKSESKDNTKKASSGKEEAGKEKTESKNGAKGEESAESAGGANAPKKEYTEDELNHFGRLSERKNELDKREVEIQKMEVELGKQKEELEVRMKELEDMRKKISAVLEDKVQLDDKRIENLVQFYSNMKPQQAAKIMESIDESLAVEVLARMKKKNAAEIMNLLKPEKAQVISEKYAGFRK